MEEQPIEAEWTTPSVALVPQPELDPVVIGFKQEIAKLLEYAQKAVVNDLDSAKNATNDIATARNLAKALEDKRKGYKAPLIAEGKRVDAFFSTLTGPLEQADKTYSGKVQSWKNEEDRKKAEAKRLNDLAEEKARIEREMAERKVRRPRGSGAQAEGSRRASGPTQRTSTATVTATSRVAAAGTTQGH
jgi:hypothetical protein